MSILNEAFDGVSSLYNPTQKEIVLDSFIDEPLYIEHNALSGVEEVPIYKRTQSLRLSSTLTEAIVEEETSGTEIENFVPFLAKITGSMQTLDQNKWYYGWTEMVYGSEGIGYGAIVDREGGLVGTAGDVETRALNLMEWDNTLDCVAPGVCLSTGCEYPEGWDLRAIGDCIEGQISPIVIMYKVRQNDTGPFRYVFQAENAHDGTCPTGIVPP